MNRLIIGVAFFALGIFPVAAAPLPLNIIVDEYGNMSINGLLSQGFFSDDPGPGGLTGVMTYNLPFVGVQGDVAVAEPGCGCLSDWIRFNGDGTLIFYSSDVDGPPAPADTIGPPQDSYPNIVIIPEMGDDAFSVALYTPGPDDPGFDASNPNYTFISDGNIPEPRSLSLMIAGLGLLAYQYYRRMRARRVIKEAAGHPSSAGRAADS